MQSLRDTASDDIHAMQCAVCFVVGCSLTTTPMTFQNSMFTANLYNILLYCTLIHNVYLSLLCKAEYNGSCICLSKSLSMCRTCELRQNVHNSVFTAYPDTLTRHRPRVGSRVVRIDPIHFLARCCTRRLNQV